MSYWYIKFHLELCLTKVTDAKEDCKHHIITKTICIIQIRDMKDIYEWKTYLYWNKTRYIMKLQIGKLHKEKLKLKLKELKINCKKSNVDYSSSESSWWKRWWGSLDLSGMKGCVMKSIFSFSMSIFPHKLFIRSPVVRI